MDLLSEFHGPNAGYVLELYERYRRDPASVDGRTRAIFEQWQPRMDELEAGLADGDIHKIVAVANLAQSIRLYGHLGANLDPLGSEPTGDPSLDPASHGLTEEDLRRLPGSLVGGPIAAAAENALEAVQALRKVYCSSVGYDYDHIRIPEERSWLRDVAESGRFRPPKDPIDNLGLLERLTQVEVFERFLHRIFPGKTRFSIEGLDMMVPMLDEIVGDAVESGFCMVFIGMAHRGRLNVLAHVMQKPYRQILAEFKDPRGPVSLWGEMGWTGDVKYHKGARGAVQGDEDEAVKLLICMPPNPSHLEHVNPVVEGMNRAAQSQMDKPGAPRFHPRAALPVLIHGEAAFPGQGVVAETLNLSRLPGYRTAGTIHIIANNQLGYTANENETRSTLYASDLAKGFKIPVLHVNADDPEACMEAARTAIAYRARFQSDILIDLVGYRRYGHNEGDEPSFTQPAMYQTIREHPSVREIWARALVERNETGAETPERLVRQGMEALQQEYERLKPEEALVEAPPEPAPRGAARRVETGVDLPRLRTLNQALLELPEGFKLNRKLERARMQRGQVLEDPDQATVDWATAEELAFATILEDGIPIRLSGEDVIRGTFSQRHAAFYDTDTEEPYIPLQAITQSRAAFEVVNTPVTENAVIGFEYGFNVQAPERMTIWEAQYGDFINVAQPMIDEFVISARAKWGITPSLVLLLPHGNEGQGPDHSSGRPERFLKLAEEGSMRVVYPSTAAQYFHLLRRQAALLNVDPLPLVVLTPKGLLRNRLIFSRARDLVEGGWQTVIDDPERMEARDQVRRLILCSGRIYIDLITSEYYETAADLAIVRLEQLHSFPGEDLKPVLEAYPRLEQITWVQEEPRNMGFWDYVRPRLLDLTGESWPLYYVGRPPSSSPGEGSVTWYQVSQQHLIKHVFDPRVVELENDVVQNGALHDGVFMEKG